MMKNKPQKTWNISLLFVYLQRTMVQIQKLIFHILKDFKEAVCEYRLFFYFLRSVSFLDFSSNVNVIDLFLWHPKKINPKKLGTYRYYSYICNVNIGQNYWNRTFVTVISYKLIINYKRGRMRIPPLFYLYYRLQRNFRALRVIRGLKISVRL